MLLASSRLYNSARILAFDFSINQPIKRMQQEYKFKGEINLTASEERIFAIFKEVRSKYELDTTFRVAGGWVRDKVSINNFSL